MQDKYYNKIKTLLIDNEIIKKVKNYSINRNDLETYYSIGKLLIEAQGGESRAKYGDNLIKEYSKKLQIEIGKKYTYTYLSRMRQFYLLFQNVAPVAQLSWSHYQEMLSLKDINKINYYIDISIKQNLSKRELRERIKNKEYERLDEKTKNKVIKQEEFNVSDFIKNPIFIRNINKYEDINEKALQQLIMENISSFLKELGSGFCFIENEYKIKLDHTYNYIDLLLYNYIYRCFIVIELKVTELKKEHIGQIQAYMNYIDKNIKTIDDNKTIGIIISKRNNRFVIEYCSDSRISFREYMII
ncbi:MAG: DUF1016 family protein [Bacilli bacterium]|nr:DUF1016 family protein [Bacilli bacterium]